MRQRHRILLLLAVALLAVALYAVFRGPSEPSYQGRSLSSWLAEKGPTEVAFMGGTLVDITEINWPDQKTAVTLRQIGTDALPFLLSWIRYEPSPWQGKLNRLLQRTGIPWTPRRHKELRANRVVTAFAILGSRAKTALPELVRLINEPRQSISARRSMVVLADFGERAILGTNARPAVLALIQCLKDRDSSVKSQAAICLGELKMEPSTVVPALAASLQDTNSRVRLCAALALQRFTGKARSAAPALLSILTDPDTQVREAATNALRNITPEVLTKAPPQ